MKIRLVATPTNAKPKVVKILEALDRECFPGDDPYPILGSYWWVIFDETQNNEPIGFAGMTYRQYNTSFLCRSGVLRPYRGRGLQRRLCKVRERKARKDGIYKLTTYTSTTNLASANNLIKCGFKLVKVNDFLKFEKVLY